MLALGRRVCGNLAEMNVIIWILWILWILKLKIFKIRKNSWILRNCKIHKIRILNLCLVCTLSFAVSLLVRNCTTPVPGVYANWFFCLREGVKAKFIVICCCCYSMYSICLFCTILTTISAGMLVLGLGFDLTGKVLGLVSLSLGQCWCFWNVANCKPKLQKNDSNSW